MNTPRPVARRRRRFFRSLVIVAAAFLCTCNHAVPPRPIIISKPVVPVKKASAAPTLEVVRKSHAEADLAAAVTAGKVTATKSRADTLGDRLLDLVNEVGAFRDTPPLAGENLLSVHRQLVDREKDARVLGVDLNDISKALAAEKNLRLIGSDKLAAATAQVHDKENEADSLRAQLASAAADNVELQTVSNRNADLANTANARAEKLQGEVNTLRWLCIGVSVVAVGLFVLAMLLRNVGRTINPLS